MSSFHGKHDSVATVFLTGVFVGEHDSFLEVPLLQRKVHLILTNLINATSVSIRQFEPLGRKSQRGVTVLLRRFGLKPVLHRTCFQSQTLNY